MNKKPIIAIDLDDVLFDTLPAWVQMFNDITDEKLSVEDITSWDIAKFVKPEHKDILFYILERPDFWERVQPKKDSQLYLKRLVDEGYNIYVATSTSHKCVNSKFKHFLELFPYIKEEKIITIHKKQLLDVDCLVDDNPDNLIGGTYHKILMNMPHNECLNQYEDNCEYVHRCYCWEDIYKLISEVRRKYNR